MADEGGNSDPDGGGGDWLGVGGGVEADAGEGGEAESEHCEQAEQYPALDAHLTDHEAVWKAHQWAHCEIGGGLDGSGGGRAEGGGAVDGLSARG